MENIRSANRRQAPGVGALLRRHFDETLRNLTRSYEIRFCGNFSARRGDVGFFYAALSGRTLVTFKSFMSSPGSATPSWQGNSPSGQPHILRYVDRLCAAFCGNRKPSAHSCHHRSAAGPSCVEADLQPPNVHIDAG